MDLTMLKRPECEITFGVDKKLSGTTNWWPRPKCDAEVDVEEDDAVVR